VFILKVNQYKTSLLGLLHPDNKRYMAFRNVDVVSRSRKVESSNTGNSVFVIFKC
jgi:hypothetical protein